MYDLLFQITLFLYIGATVGFLMHLVTLKNGARKAAFAFLGTAFSLHTIIIILRWIEAKHPPLINMHESLSFFAWAISAFFMLFQWKERVKSLGAFVVPIATFSMVGAAFRSKKIAPLPPSLQSWWLPIHATICLISYGVFALAFAIALMYVIQERQIKKKRLGAFFKRLPSLQTLDKMGQLCLKIGFPLLTLGIITGSMWADSAWGSYWSWDPKETWSLITWLLYAALLHQRLAVGWRGRRAAYMTIIAFGVLLFTFLGVNYVLPGLHSYSTWYE